ncbi:MAG TPA: c-type cytochrome [Stenotrophobium sp.]|nr:c-type cytochrome [Stenotrophobium sp.]
MQQEDHDKGFFRSFGMVLGGLFALFFLCIVAARLMTPAAAPDQAELARLDQRTAPIGQVVTDPKALMALAASKPARTPYTGEQVVTKVCSACHQSGMLGAPKIGDKAEWSKREKAAGGVDGLVKIAIKGLNSMPPRGGDADLSDAEIKAGIEYMLSK